MSDNQARHYASFLFVGRSRYDADTVREMYMALIYFLFKIHFQVNFNLVLALIAHAKTYL